MKTVHAIFENGVFRPTEPVELPEGSSVEFEPRVSEEKPRTTLDELYELLSERFDSGELADSSDWQNWFRSGGFDHIERHDDRIQLFATRLSEGLHEFSYIVRATTVGTFRTAPARAEEMYSPEIFGRTGTTTIEVKR